MKKALVISCLMALLVSGATLAAEDNWRIGLKGDDGVGWPGYSRVGVHPLASDGEYPYDQQWAPAMEVDVVVLQTIPGSSGVWSTVVNSPSLPNVWDFRVAALTEKSRVCWLLVGLISPWRSRAWISTGRKGLSLFPQRKFEATQICSRMPALGT